MNINMALKPTQVDNSCTLVNPEATVVEMNIRSGLRELLLLLAVNMVWPSVIRDCTTQHCFIIKELQLMSKLLLEGFVDSNFEKGAEKTINPNVTLQGITMRSDMTNLQIQEGACIFWELINLIHQHQMNNSLENNKTNFTYTADQLEHLSYEMKDSDMSQKCEKKGLNPFPSGEFRRKKKGYQILTALITWLENVKAAVGKMAVK
ncbi:uncharacterized protein LOC120541136 [Polypterus senegalus]|uniref:uncharacterized protein LOC120541136 n=1 Tax=Polypterus senegalus TaxID=55291 RepID=UPI0019639B08|nr:uncharacterized protein LOC120541136 [Polypterus senegalus]